MDQPNDTKRALRSALERMIAAFERATGDLPTAEPLEDMDSSVPIFRGPPGDDGLAHWTLVEKTTNHDVAAELGAAVHPSVSEYFNSDWFCELTGSFGNYGLSLAPVLPGLELDDTVIATENQRRSGVLERVPLGTDVNGLIVVVNNADGTVALHDWESDALIPLAPSLAELLDGLRWA